MSKNKKDEDSVSRTKAVSTIPWMSAPPLSNKSDNTKVVKLEDGDFCEEMLECEGKRNFRFYQMLNQIFPYFLPKRYHTMDSWRMHLQSEKGQFWNHASHFLMMNKIPDVAFNAYLHGELKSENPDLSKFVPSYDIMGEVTHLEQCESAAEFLLEPWVLIQLPLHPVLLHQWTVALMAETLKFQKEMTEVLYLPFPSHVSSQLTQLKNMVEVMFEATMQLTQLVFEWYFPPKGLNQRFSDLLVETKKKLDSLFPQLLPVIEFVMSQDGKTLIKALKRMTWNSKNRLSHHDLKKGSLQTKSLDMTLHCCIYSWDFWKAPHPHIFMYYTKTAEDLTKFKPLEQIFKDSIEAGRRVPFIKPARDDFCKLIDEHIIKPGRIRGVSREKILKTINWKDTRMNYYFNAMGRMFYLGGTSQHNFAKDGNYGVIFNVINLYCDLKYEELVVGLMSVLASQHISQGVYFEPVGCEDARVNIKMNDIKRALASAKPNDKWLHGNMLKQVKATCFSPERQFFPDYSQGAKLIAEHFQERIKNLVFKMIECQSRMMKDSTVQVYPECQTVQYLLPCFVASFLDLEKDKSVSQEEKKKYLNFVHELVKSYEEKEFRQTLVKGWTKKGWFTLIQGKLMNWKVGHWVQNIRDCLAKEVPTALDAFCGNVLTFMTADICGSFEASYFKCKEGRCPIKPWTLQMFMFLCRVNATLEDLGWLDDSKFHAVNFMASLISLVQPKFGIKTAEQGTVKVINPINDFEEFKDLYEFCKNRYNCDHEVSSGDVSCGCVQEMNVFLYFRAGDIPQMGKDRGDLFKLQSPFFPVDTTDAMLWNLEHQNWWKLMHQIKNFMHRCPLLKNKSLTVTLEFARKSGRYPLQDLTSDGKVKMSHPGEITFFPVEHCRWCGLVEVKEFRKCPECLQNPDYLDVNIFCSEVCEKEALEKQHLEEHARFLMEKCGLIN